MSSSPSPPAVYGPCPLSADTPDSAVFNRCPSRLTPIAIPTPISSFPGGSGRKGLVDFVRRTSATAYSVVGAASDTGVGARFAAYGPNNTVTPSIVWVSPSTLETHAGDPSIVDTIHTDLIDETDGTSRASPADIRGWCSPAVRHLLLNPLGSGGALGVVQARTVAEGIAKCEKLQTFFAAEWERIPPQVFEALEGVAGTLRGLHLHGGGLKGGDFAPLTKLLKACGDLRWLGVDVKDSFNDEFLKALPASLEVLVLRSYKDTDGLDLEALKKLTNLKLRLVFPKGMQLVSK